MKFAAELVLNVDTSAAGLLRCELLASRERRSRALGWRTAISSTPLTRLIDP